MEKIINESLVASAFDIVSNGEKCLILYPFSTYGDL